MPSVYVFDGKGGRTWNEIIGPFTPCEWKSSTLCPQPQRGDVLVFHQQSGDVQKAVEYLGAQGVWIVAVGMGEGKGQLMGRSYYQHGRGVSKPTDNRFKVCFKHFMERLKATGTPKWQLLEGPPAPDALLAYYLLGLLPEGDKKAEEARDEQLRLRALDEAEDRRSRDGIKVDGLGYRRSGEASRFP